MTGPPVYCPYPRRLESSSMYNCNYKGSTFVSVILRPWVLVRPQSNSRPPEWQPDAQPTEPPVSGCMRYPHNTIPTGTICNLIRMILAMNNFTFNNSHNFQIHGTAMDTKMAPSFANLFLGHFEKNSLRNAPFQPHTWLRYIDDIFMIWTESPENLKILIKRKWGDREGGSRSSPWDMSCPRKLFLD